MGCGRSRHRSPSLQADGPHKDKDKDNLKENGKDNNKDKDKDSSSKRGSKKQKQADKQSSKAAVKREPEVARNSPRKATNGKTGEVPADWSGGGATDKKDSVSRRNWQLEEAIDTPPETAVAVYRSSVPASARASLKAPLTQESTNSFSSNGAVLNGSSEKGPAMAQEIEMQMEIPDKTLCKDSKSSPGNAKPVHITSSQLEFFKMLDEKIEKGADYNSDDE